MDAILFYGKDSRSDASRRQVRSAAAQHSHRIGPRKPKSSKKPKSSSSSSASSALDPSIHQQKRSLRANSLNPASSAPTSAVVGRAGKLAVASAFPYHLPPTATSAQPSSFGPPGPPPTSAHAGGGTALPVPVDSPNQGRFSGVVDREKELKRQAAQARFQEIQAIQLQHQAHADHEPQQAQQHQTSHALAPVRDPDWPALQAPGPPPLAIERIEQTRQDSHPSTHSRENSQASQPSPSTRLPQYSWTEYPRYGLGSNSLSSSLQMLAQVAVAERESNEPRSSLPTAAHDVPGFRQFRIDDSLSQPQSTPSKNPTSSPQSNRLHDRPLTADRSCAASCPERGLQLAPLAVQPLTERPPLSASATFGQFLQSAFNGHERVDEVHQKAKISPTDEEASEKKPHFSKGGAAIALKQ